MSKKSAMIWGVTGQDGSYLSELLLGEGYEVIGVKRRSSTNNLGNLANVIENPDFELVEGDITDAHSVSGLVKDHQPTELYNVAAMSHVGTSFQQPSYTFMANAVGELNILEAIRQNSPKTKHFFAATSEMMGSNFNVGKDGEKYQDETTPLSANSPYAAAKLASYHLVKMYREGYGLFACSSITHNHESERRGENFVTRKITKYIGKYAQKFYDGDQPYYKMPEPDCIPKLKLGNIDSIRDFSYAPDIVRAFYLMLQQEKPQDYMLCSGIGHSIRDFLSTSFGWVESLWEDYVEIDPSLYRPVEVPFLRGVNSKATNELGWKPNVNFVQMVTKMVVHDIDNG
jgi:GDPmannose 4,6-dehydratase